MKQLLLSFIIILMLTGLATAQENIILTFSAVNGTTLVPVDQVWIRNLTKQCDTLLPPEGSTINLGPVGINDFDPAESLQLSVQATPNPLEHHSDIILHMPSDGQLDILISANTGQVCLTYSQYLNAGNHQFQFFPGKASMYLISFRVGSHSGYLKMVSMGHGLQECRLDLMKSNEPGEKTLKKTENRGFVFSPGDELLLSCQSGGAQSGMILTPTNAQQVVFQFASNVPCPGLETVTYEGKVYNTVQIFGQCWLKENMDIGTMINGSIAQSDNGVIEKYCFQDDPANCEQYGGLYQWSEMMQYINEDNDHRGICPGDWHLPTDMEWMILEGSVDSQYGIGNEFWYHDGNRGFDAGKNLKATQGYQNNGNGTDLYGFTALPGGVHHDDGSFIGKTKYAVFWTGTRSISVFCATYRLLDYYYDLIYRDAPDRSDAMSVRCIKD
jgi:uncharacterized protein (TIGR02145 family)